MTIISTSKLMVVMMPRLTNLGSQRVGQVYLRDRRDRVGYLTHRMGIDE